MKRILAFLIMIGISIGAYVVFREANVGKEVEIIKESGDQEIYRDELNLPLIELDIFNPLLTKNKQVSDTLKLIYEPLFDFNEKNFLEPKLASEWSEIDETTWIIKLNSNIKWHDGKNLVAEDVIFTYQTILNYDSVYKNNLINISSVEKIDSNAVKIKLVNRDKRLLYQLTFPIIPAHYFNKSLEDVSKAIKAVGTGPYRYESGTIDEKIITLKVNDLWWNDEKIKLNTIYLYQYTTYGEAMKAFKSTEIDVIATSMSSWQKKFGAIGINAYPYESSEFETIIPNTENIVLSESSVRRMFLSAINTENIIETVYIGSGKVSDYPIPSNSYLNATEVEKKYDIEKAKQLLLNAGWENKDGTWKKQINGKRYTLTFNLLVNSESEEKLKIANLIVENLKEIGVQIKIVKVKSDEYQKRILEGKYELALATLNLDMDIDILELLTTNNSKNYAKYQNSEMMTIIGNMTHENMEKVFPEIQTLYKNETPYIGMYYKLNHLLTNKSVKGDIYPTSWNVYHGIIGWCK